VQGNINAQSPAAKVSEALRLRDNLFWTNPVPVASSLGLPPGDTNAPVPVPLMTFPGNREADPGLRDAASGDFALLPDGAARNGDAGAPVTLQPTSPWPLQPEEQAIIPTGDTRDSRAWKRPRGA
jgi:hypothetical protein